MKFLRGFWYLNCLTPCTLGAYKGAPFLISIKLIFYQQKKGGGGGFYSKSEKTNLADRVVQPLEIL